MHVTILETRRLLSVMTNGSGGITVTGTAGNDGIIVSVASGNLDVEVNGQTSDFPMTPTTTLEVDGLAGNDILAADGSVPKTFGITFRGGDGNDLLSGGAGPDTMFGDDGNDTLDGEGGGDTLDGGFGSDVMDGGDNDPPTIVAQETRSEPYLAFADGLPDSGGPGEHDTIARMRGTTLGAGINVICGTQHDDQIVLNYFAGDLVLNINGKTDYWPDPQNSAAAIQINALSGDDSVEVDSSVPSGISLTVNGGSGNDLLMGGANRDQLVGGDGNDTISGGGGNDRIIGGSGNDSLSGGAGNDVLNGGLGTDTISGGRGFDRDNSYLARNAPVFVSNSGLPESGESGEDDTIDPDVESLSGGAKNDTIIALGSDLMRISGGAGDDLITSRNTAGASIFGGDGNDTIVGGQGDDTVDGGLGSDDMSGGSGHNTISYASDDRGDHIDLRGTSLGGGPNDFDVIAPNFQDAIGGAGNDTIYGNAKNNRIDGGDGDDVINGEAGDDTIAGGEGDDFIHGGAGIDRISGGGGNDRIYITGAGGDFINGGSGHDYLYGVSLKRTISVEILMRPLA